MTVSFSLPIPSRVQHVSADHAEAEQTPSKISTEIQQTIIKLGQSENADKKQTLETLEKQMAELDIRSPERGAVLAEISKPAILSSLDEEELGKLFEILTMHSISEYFARKIDKNGLPVKLRNPDCLTLEGQKNLCPKNYRLILIKNLIEYVSASTTPVLDFSKRRGLEKLLKHNVRTLVRAWGLTGDEARQLATDFANAFAKTKFGKIVQDVGGTEEPGILGKWKIARAMNTDAVIILNSGLKEVPEISAAGTANSNTQQKNLTALLRRKENTQPKE